MPAENERNLPQMEIFRAREYSEDGPMSGPPMTQVQQQGMAALFEAGMMSGSEVKLLYGRPGMSLTYCPLQTGLRAAAAQPQRQLPRFHHHRQH